MRLPVILGVLLGLPIISLAAQAQTPTWSGDALVNTLRRGGYVLVVRHASSPREAPDKQTANPDNVDRERQLDANGRATATAMGNALRALGVPIGDVLTSPTYRAQETVRLAQWPHPRLQEELGDGGHSMQGITDAQAAWLRQRVTQFAPGTNTILVTHLPNIQRAFPSAAEGLTDGETLVFGPDGKGGVMVVARIPIEQWPTLRARP